jgi:hypothetical protein
MKLPLKSAVAACAVAGALLFACAPADAQLGVSVGVPGVRVGVGVPGYYYGPGYYPPGPCDAYNNYYEGDCGYSVYDGPIDFDGVVVTGPHYYRWYGDQPYFWYRGGWHTWNGWNGAHFSWDHGEGFGWHEGHWDRDWGRAHWHGDRDRHDDHH